MDALPDALNPTPGGGNACAPLVHNIVAGWWEQAFSTEPSDEDQREWTMLMVVAYDIRDPRRLARVARHCEDYGGRVQYSVFEVRLTADRFDHFWEEIQRLIDPREDRLVAYRVCQECARKIRISGTQTLTPESPSAFIF
ncbi:MAG: CRISPR-associated endonuclease Cas2 [Kiritimatiellae bacterium]|nr:CRISPR-associated endonuclease Cas2 [Kiritimatiellia bacterium]